MREPYLLAGGTAGNQPPPSPAGSSGMLRVLIILWLLAGAGFAIWKFGGWQTKPAAPPPSAAPRRVAGIATEDLVHHIATVNADLAELESRSRRIEDEITRSLPAITRNELYAEKKHLENALAANVAARRNL